MKKSLLSFMMCTIALCMMSQVSWATDLVTIQGNKVIVNSTSAGSLAHYVRSLTTEQKAALNVDEIVFIGKFNEEDLREVQGPAFGFKTVDMGEAKFVRNTPGGSNYSLYHNGTPNGGNNGDKCIVGGTRYVGQKQFEWVEVDNPGNVNFQNSEGWTVDNVNSEVHRATYNVNDYVKIPTGYNYYRKDGVWNEISDVSFPIIYENFNADGAKWYAWTWWDGQPGTLIPLPCSPSVLRNNVIFIRRNPKASGDLKWDDPNDVWNRTGDLRVETGKVFVMTGYTGNTINGNWKDYVDKTDEYWTVESLKSHKSNNDGDIVKINDNDTDKFYRYAGLEWTSISEIDLPENVTINNPNWSESDRNDHLGEYGDPHVYIRFAAGYKYYQKRDNNEFYWKQADYNDGDNAHDPSFFDSTDEMGTPSSDRDVAIVGGTVYECQNGSWTPASGDNDTYDYSQMKFSYWSGTIEKAVTSKYADEHIPNEIFQNCKKLTEVDYKAGNVTGFNDHKTSDGYASGLTVTIGKNVTSIKDNAFLRCDALSTLVFDKDYSDSNADKLDGVTYPLELTIGEGAFQNCTNLTGVEFPNRVVSIGNDAFKEAGTGVSEMTVSFERRSGDGIISFDRNLTIGQAAFQNCTKLKEIELPIRLLSMGEDAFKGTTSLTSVSIREDIEDARLTTIPTGAFENSGITSISIPRSVTEIQTHAFASCYNLETVRFQEQIVAEGQSQEPLIIRNAAFAGGAEGEYKLKDVWVDIDPQKRLLVCEYNAFHFEAIVGQTDVSSNQIATLHFSENYWDYYAGEWKKGLAFSQASLNSFKDGFNVKRGNQQPTVASQGLVAELQPANGWQQFAKTSTGIEIELPKGKFVRSYSVSKPCEIPRFANTERTPFVRIYRVTAFSDGWKNGDAIDDQEAAMAATRIATATEVTGYIPKNTGLLMVGLGDETQKYVMYPNYYNEDDPDHSKTYVWAESGDDINLLEPTCDEPVTINPTIPYPFRSKSEITHRLFGFKANKVTNDGGVFLRSQPGVQMKPNQAYLKLPVSMFHWGNEAGDNGSGLSGSAGAKDIILEFATDIFEDGVATAITNSTTAVDRQASTGFYTLQGQRVERPTAKGIYIYNGKKIMVK